MSNNGAPDSWESQAEVVGEKGANDNEISPKKISTLNVNAVEFVPSFCTQPSQDESPTKSQKSESSPTSSDGSPVLNGMSCHYL